MFLLLELWQCSMALFQSDCNIRNYSVFFKDDVLFGYFEYHGKDIKEDWAKMAADAKTQEWWAIMGPYAGSISNAKTGGVVGRDGRSVPSRLKLSSEPKGSGNDFILPAGHREARGARGGESSQIPSAPGFRLPWYSLSVRGCSSYLSRGPV